MGYSRGESGGRARHANGGCMRSANLSAHALLFASAAATGQVIMLIVLAAMGREIGPARLGVVAVTLAVAAAGAGVIDFGANSYWLRELAAGRLPGPEFGRRSGGKVAVSVVAAAALVLGALLSGPPLRAYWGVGLVLLAVVIVQTLQVAVKATERNAVFAAAVLLDRVVLGLSWLALRFGLRLDPETAFYLAYLVGAAVDGWLCWRAVPGDMRPTLRGASLGTTWSGTRAFGVSTLLTTGQQLDTVIAGVVGGQVVAGTYGAVNRWTQPVALATNAFSTLLAAVAAKARDASDLMHRIRSSLWLIAVSVVGALGMAVLAEPLVLLVMGEAFAESALALRILGVGAAVNALTTPLLVVLQARGRERLVAGALAAAVSLQLALVAPLAVLDGARGVALAYLAAQTVLLVVFLTGACRSLRRVVRPHPA